MESREYVGLPKGFLIESARPKVNSARLRNRVKAATQTLVIGVFAAFLAITAMACPLWMASTSHDMASHGKLCSGMPCFHQSKSPHQCPLTICEASSPYLTSDVSTSTPLLTELPNEAVSSIVRLISLTGNAELIRRDDLAPPGLSTPLLLQTHSLLI